MYLEAKGIRIILQTGLDSLRSDQMKLPDDVCAKPRAVGYYPRFRMYNTRFCGDLSAIWMKETSRAGTDGLLLHESEAPAREWTRESGRLGREGVSISGVSREWSEWGRGQAASNTKYGYYTIVYKHKVTCYVLSARWCFSLCMSL